MKSLDLVPGVVCLLACAFFPANAQAPAQAKGKAVRATPPPPPPGPAGSVPRTPEGKPDLSGIWNGQRALPGQPDPEMLPWARALLEKRATTNYSDDLEARCLPGGPPRAAPYHYQVVQTPKLVTILYEGNIHSYRQFFLDSEHPKNLKPTWYGDSRAHWEGDTLVVDTIGLNDKSWIDMPGHPHTAQMHVIERYHRRDLGNLEIQNIIEDPGAYTKPWVINRVSTLEQGIEMSEYVCNENNLDPGHLDFSETSKVHMKPNGVDPPAARRPPPPPAGATPQTAQGRVDFSGLWVLQGSPNLPSDPSYQPAFQKLYAERKSQPKSDPERYCLPDGIARVNSLPYKFVQTPALIAVLPEGNTRAFRRIFLDGRDHSKQLELGDTWSGDSTGTWDGDTLVVDIVGVNDRSWLDATGKPHSDALHVTERYLRPNLGHLEVQYTLADPKAFTKPYSFRRTFTLAPASWEIQEYICMDELMGPFPSHQSQAPKQ